MSDFHDDRAWEMGFVPDDPDIVTEKEFYRMRKFFKAGVEVKVPYGDCHCGCGRKTALAKETNKHSGAVKGEPRYFCLGHHFQKDKVSQQVGRQRALKLYKNIGPCSKCGNPKSQRHHIDGNTLNNSPENIQILCSYHHQEVDGRLEIHRERIKHLVGNRNGLLTHCKRGHEFNPENTVTYSNKDGRPYRTCLICRPIRMKAWMERKGVA